MIVFISFVFEMASYISDGISELNFGEMVNMMGESQILIMRTHSRNLTPNPYLFGKSRILVFMRKGPCWFLLLMVLMCGQLCLAQNKVIDSLKNVLIYTKQDTSKVEILFELAKLIKDKSVWPAYNDQMLNLSEKNLKKYQGSPALTKYYSKYYAAALSNVAFLANLEGDVPKAIEFNSRALKIREQLKDQKGIAISLNNIAGIYNFQGEYEKALEYFKRSLEIRKELGDNIGLLKCLNNITLIYINTSSLAKADEYAKQALETATKNNDQTGLAYVYNNLGQISSGRGDSLTALSWFLKGHVLEPENVYNLNFIARMYYEMDSLPKAEAYCKKGMEIGRASGNPINLRNAARLLKEVYLKEHKPDEALKMYELYIRMRDSTYNAETKRSAIKSQLQYDFDKKEILLNEAKARQALIYEQEAKRNKLQFEFEQSQAKFKSDKEKQQLTFDENMKRLKLNQEIISREAASKAEQEKREVAHAAQNRQKMLVIYGIIAGLLIVSIFSFYLFRRFRITQRQKAIIEKQKELVEEHRKEIIDSITYAKRLQQAILPATEAIKRFFPESFLLYKPKDIVAGDFYWMEHFDDTIYIAAADCTGHGVPGAMVSIVCSNALNRAVKEFGVRDTGLILDKTRDLVVETFAKSNSEVKDGMDISLLALNRSQNRIWWSGANNQLWYMQDGAMQEITACKQPIGKTDNPKPFKTHTFETSKDMTIYLMTDGYPDQFGGPKGKKYKYKPLQEMLVSNDGKSMEQLNEMLSAAFTNWKGNLEQVDDVTIMGLRI
jgi:serine phosphatase RsbU (regulator of sigma subunit)